jgi:Zn-dependent protease with chaperone function
MEFSSFLNSYPGSYIVQSFSHSVITASIVEIAIKAWRIRNPTVRQRLLLIVLVAPIFSFPVYQLINPQRGSVYFRLDALLDSSRWIDMELWGVVPIRYGFLLVFFLTAVIFFFQELVPILRHTYESSGSGLSGERAERDSMMAQTLKDLPVEKADIFLLEDEDVILFSTTGRKGSIYLSSGLLRILDRDQVRAAVAHEFAHVIRSRRPLLVVMFLLRMIMFFNPVVLMEFRRIVQEDEKICDDYAVSLTRNPLALAESLRKLYLTENEGKPGKAKDIMSEMEALEVYSHRLNIESRITRLEKGYANTGEKGWFAIVLTLAVVLVMNYFIV